MAMKNPTVASYIQYGCGFCSPEEWCNFDSSPTLRFERVPVLGKFYTKNEKRFPANVQYGDIVIGLPIERDSCKAVYCSHILEHLSLEDLRTALGNTYSILSPGGVFRLVVPDLQYSINKYVQSVDYTAALDFMRETLIGTERRPKTIPELIRYWLGNSKHLWMWDFSSMRHELQLIGFENIRRAEFGDSEDAMFSLVEDSQRWRNSLGISCSKPC